MKMGSFSRLYDKLRKLGVSEHDLTDVAYAIGRLESAGDDLGDIMFMWHDRQVSKEEAIENARTHLKELSKAVDQIAIAK